jgi:hypothetical protein
MLRCVNACVCLVCEDVHMCIDYEQDNTNRVYATIPILYMCDVISVFSNLWS